jgi:hypothetical protein
MKRSHQDRVTFFIVKNDHRLLSPTNVLAKCLFFYLRHTEPFVPTIEIPCPSGPAMTAKQVLRSPLGHCERHDLSI